MEVSPDIFEEAPAGDPAPAVPLGLKEVSSGQGSSGGDKCTFSVTQPNILCSELPHTPFDDLPKAEGLALCYCSDIWMVPPETRVCDNHYQSLVGWCMKKTTSLRKNCCDPFMKHKKNVKTGLREITPLAAVKAKVKKIIQFAGDYYCDYCRKEIDKLEVTVSTSSSQASSNQDENIVISGASTHVMGLSPDVIKEELKHNLESFDLSPIALTASSSKPGCVHYAKRKLEDVSNIARKKFCYVLDIEEKDVLASQEHLSTASNDLNTICSEIKDKIAQANFKTKLQYLTVCPPSWSINFAANYFGVSRYLVEEARRLKEKSGILSVPIYSKDGLFIPESTRKLVLDFYCEDSNSRILPGKKDFVSNKRGQHVQKRLVLFSLRELYALFKEKEAHKDVKIGFSLFCALRPKWCVLAGAAGTHNVCVCTYHQNMKLMLHALRIKNPLSNLIEQFVCNTVSRECMLSLCTKCPSKNTITDFIKSKYSSELSSSTPLLQSESEESASDIDGEVDEDIQFKEWTSTDRAELLTCVCKVPELFEKVATKMKILIPHHFTSHEQSTFFKKSKENLSDVQAIRLMDFSMNYTCVLQDAVQSYHWAKNNVTLHPVVIYLKDSNGSGKKNVNLTFLSDDSDHDISMVKVFVSKTLNFLKEHYPQIKEVMFMTDGCPSQYKTCAIFSYLCKIQDLFGLKATWCFYATSHGKSTCDGIGGMIKREATMESLRRPLDKEILDAQSLFEFCLLKLSTAVTFFFVKKQEVDLQRTQDTQDRESKPKLKTVPGTRSFHHYFPLSDTIVGCKRVSSDEDYDLVHDLSPSLTGEEEMKLVKDTFVPVNINSKQYIGLVMDIDVVEKEVDLTLLSPALPSAVFLWPQEEMNCYVAPIPDILCNVQLFTVDNFKYQIPSSEILKIRQLGRSKRRNRVQPKSRQ